MAKQQAILNKFAPVSHADYDVWKGSEVLTRDGEKVGKIASILHPDTDFESARGRHYFLLDPGLMRDWFGGLDETYLPETAIAGYTEEGVVLNLTKDQLKNESWVAPAGLEMYRRF